MTTITLFATQYAAQEWSYTSPWKLADPFNDVELDVIVTHESGQSWRIPAYWSLGQEWRVRFAPPLAGSYQAVEAWSGDRTMTREGISIQAAPIESQGPLPGLGRLQNTPNGRTLQFDNGAPFLWLGDTWWMGLCKRIGWPEEFQALAAGRAEQGFNVVQIVAGLYPDMPGFDPRGANEAGFPWESDYRRINPAYFDMADLRIRWLAHAGLVACIVGSWGYYLPLLGLKKMKQHWRNLVARWGAYPVVWCLAGEAAMPYYLSTDKAGDEQKQREGFTEIARYVRSIDPYQRLVTIHPTAIGRDQVLNDGLLDLDMLQTGHDGYRCIPNTVEKITQEYARTPAMPVLVSECNYENIIHGTNAEIQRLTFWSSFLSGGCGFTYGANGLWQLNNPDQPYGASPWGGSWGGPTWQEAARQPGAAHLALAKQLLERYAWWNFEPHPEWVDPHGSPDNVDLPFAAGVAGEVRIIYFYWPSFQYPSPSLRVTAFEKDVRYRAFFWDPRNGTEHDLGLVVPDPEGVWPIPIQPELKDWVVVLERVEAR